MKHRTLALTVAVTLIAVACGGEAAPPTTQPPATTTTQPPTTTTTLPPSTTTSTIPYAALDVSVTGDDGASAAVQGLYQWFGDRTLPPTGLPPGLVEHLATTYATGSATFTGEIFASEIGELGRVGVVVVNEEDFILVVDEAEAEGEDDPGWRVVGAWMAQYGAEPWFGDPLRYVFVIGTDARPGELQPHLRADSLHILSSNVAERSGGILGIPRDTQVAASYGTDKFTNVNALLYTANCGRGTNPADCDEADDGQNEMVQLARDFSGLPLEGWIITGFLGFRQLIDAFGGVEVDVPVGMAEPNAEAYFSAGLQRLFGLDALAFSRNRKQFGEIGDFVRSLHQGMLMLGALDDVLTRDLTAAPELLAMLMEFTWTNLSLEDLFTMAAGGLLLDPAQVGNQVVPATGSNTGGAYYAFFAEGAEEMFRDMDDGSLTPGESWLTALYAG